MRNGFHRGYYYKARAYDPSLGRFLQTDPIGYQSDMNAYAYTANDPINRSDSTGLACDYTVTVDSGLGDGSFNVIGDFAGGPGCDDGDGGGFFNLGGFGGSVSGPDGGRDGKTNPTLKPQPKTDLCGPTSIWPHGAGVQAGGVVEAGVPWLAGVAGAIGGGGGVFNSQNQGTSFGGYTYTGGSAYAAGSSTSIQPQVTSPGVLGASIGAGLSGFITNAQSSQQLSGPFATYSANVGVGPFKASASLSVGGGIWQFSFGPPIAGLSAGLSVSRITTTTMNTSGCH